MRRSHGPACRRTSRWPSQWCRRRCNWSRRPPTMRRVPPFSLGPGARRGASGRVGGALQQRRPGRPLVPLVSRAISGDQGAVISIRGAIVHGRAPALCWVSRDATASLRRRSGALDPLDPRHETASAGSRPSDPERGTDPRTQWSVAPVEPADPQDHPISRSVGLHVGGGAAPLRSRGPVPDDTGRFKP